MPGRAEGNFAARPNWSVKFMVCDIGPKNARDRFKSCGLRLNLVDEVSPISREVRNGTSIGFHQPAAREWTLPMDIEPEFSTGRKEENKVGGL